MTGVPSMMELPKSPSRRPLGGSPGHAFACLSARNVSWPGSDLALPVILGSYLVVAVVLVKVFRRNLELRLASPERAGVVS